MRLLPRWVYGGSYRKGMVRCHWCQAPIVFSEQDILWIDARGRIRDKVVCEPSPDRRHSD